MMKREIKCVEYYFDSKLYNKMQVLEALEKEKKQFPKNKNPEIKIQLNSYGIYIATLLFQKEDAKEKNKQKRNWIKINKRLEKYDQKQRRYGQYKETRLYEPY